MTHAPNRPRALPSAVLLCAALLAGCATAGREPEPAADATGGSGGRLLAIGRTLLDERRHADARTAFERLLRARQDDPEAQLGLGEALLGLGDAAGASRSFAAAARREETGARALQGLGLAMLRLGDTTGAEAALAAALDREPGLWRAWNAKGRLHDTRQEWREARAAYARALELGRDKELVLNNWGMSLLAEGRHAAAVDKFREALRTRPDLTTARTNLQLALALDGRDHEVFDVQQGEPRARALNNVAYGAMLRGDYDRAETYLHQAIEVSPAFYALASRNLQLLDSLRTEAHEAPGCASSGGGGGDRGC